MRIGIDVSSLQRSRWGDYGLRFVFGGIVTAITGMIAKTYGPGVAGIFLAFPAIFPAGATLIENTKKRRRVRRGSMERREAELRRASMQQALRWELLDWLDSRHWFGNSYRAIPVLLSSPVRERHG
jgi:hypothetical protein